jgi:hypothetical protein
MRADQVNTFINEFISILRDLKLNSCFGEDILKIKSPKTSLWNKILYRKMWKKINEFNKIGGILTGSRALKYYNLNGVPLLNRKCDDWDIILSKSTLFKFCNKYKISNLLYENNRIMINFSTGIYTGSGNYSDSPTYIFKHDFDILSNQDESNIGYIECGGYKITPLEYILHEKIKIIKNEVSHRIPNSDYTSKHLSDCIEIMVKIVAHSGEKQEALIGCLRHDDLGKTFESLKDVLEITK